MTPVKSLTGVFMGMIKATDGEFAGWEYWDNDSFEKSVGPFFFRREENGKCVGAFRAEERHMNGGGSMHGGCMMSFADFGLFVIPLEVMDELHGVTVTMNSEFIGGAKTGELMEVRGDVLRAGGSLVFTRGMITADGRPCLNFSGTVKRLKR